MPDSLTREFERHFGRLPEWVARAPGRVNLIGEHTDYNLGLVLPCAIDRDTWVLAARRDDTRFRVFSRERGELVHFDAAQLERRSSWIDYVQGVVFSLAARGVAVRGADLAIASRVPLEAGLSSSAALGVAVATALDGCNELGLDAETRALVALGGEVDFVGVGCGLMDPFASALGRRGCALRIDCRTRDVVPVSLPAERIALVIAHSGVQRALAEHGYRRRVSECRDALARARATGVAPPGAESLRDLDASQLSALAEVLDSRGLRRVRHVLRENERVETTCAAFRAGDLETVGALLREGMRSLRDDFEVSTRELDLLCELGDAQPGVYGSRLTGAGFGGCTLHLVEPAAADEVVEALSSGFERHLGRRPATWLVTSADGATCERWRPGGPWSSD